MLSVEPLPWRRRFLVVTIFAVGVLIFAQTWLTDRHLAYASAIHRTDHPIQTPLQQVRPEFTADVDMWVRYALDVLEGREGPRVRHTDLDNAPAGREVHWNSALTWWIAGLGWSWHIISGLPLPAAVERIVPWANLPLVLAFIVGFAVWAGRRAGALGGGIVAVAIFGHRAIYEGFLPSYPDHHGLIAAGVLGLVLGMLFMGGGWIRGPVAPLGLSLLPADENAALSAARWGAFWGGFGLWISTASLALPLLMVPFGAAFATLVCRRGLVESGARFHAGVWRVWGRTGAITSLAFYLFEYFPFHLGWRLEVNHPLYALSWWAGAELTACALEALAAPPGQRRAPSLALARCAAWAVPASLAPALVILWFRSAVFLPLDPFLVRLHATIGEFLPLLDRLALFKFTQSLDFFIVYPAFYVVALVLLFLTPRAQRFLLLLCLVPAVALLALGFWQGRWAMSAGSVHVPLLLACLGCAFARPALGATPRRRWAVAAVAAAFFFSFSPAMYFWGLTQVLSNNTVPNDEAIDLIYREIAQAIRDSQPDGKIVLFASPNTSVNVGYYGRFQTVGTLYWENVDGLKAAAAINSAPSDEAAARLIRRRGVTHLALVSRENYLAEYARLLYPGISPAGVERTFAYRLLVKGQIPVWLEPVLYRAPTDLSGDLANLRVLLFKVNFAQNETTLFYRLGLLLTLFEQPDQALERFAHAAELDPKSPAPWLRRSEILLQKKLWREAADNLAHGADLSSPDERYRLLTMTGTTCEQQGEVATAIVCYRRAVAGKMSNIVALNNLAWCLATARQAELRNPVEALKFAETAAAAEPNVAGIFNTLAAALAANQRFPEAIAAAEKAVKLAEGAGDQGNATAFRQHLAAFQAGQPWRQ